MKIVFFLFLNGKENSYLIDYITEQLAEVNFKKWELFFKEFEEIQTLKNCNISADKK